MPIDGTNLPDPCPRHWGNPDIKKIILYALCVFEEGIPESIVPIFLIAKSGEGKTQLINSMVDAGLPAKIYSKDAVTQASLGMLKGEKPVFARLSKIMLFDETNKWDLNKLEGVMLPIFGAETGTRIRSAQEIEILKDLGLPIATLLPQWEEFEGSGSNAARRVHTIEQVLRRSVLLRVEPTSASPTLSREFVRRVFAEWFQNFMLKDKGEDYEAIEQEVLFQTLSRADSIEERLIDPEALSECIEMVDQVRHQIIISERVHYAEHLPLLIIKLAQGRALAYGRSKVSKKDFEDVRDILVNHAKRLGMYSERGPNCPSCGNNMVNNPGPQGDEWSCSRYPHCRKTLSYEEGVALRDKQDEDRDAKAKKIEKQKREATEKAYASVDTRKDPTADDPDT